MKGKRRATVPQAGRSEWWSGIRPHSTHANAHNRFTALTASGALRGVCGPKNWPGRGPPTRLQLTRRAGEE